jgi:16S rRNA (adenine1518-N6/adenine1519-N6)-dimethyltransferase
MKLSEVKQTLAQANIQLTKSLGQNFMHDGNQLRRIIRAAELTVSDRVLEVGPGLGPLTNLLLEEAGEVLAIEKDQRLVEFLRQRFRDQARLRLVHADALEYLRHRSSEWSDWKLVANLPYSVASRLLVELAKSNEGPGRIVVTLQLEVARRMVAQAGDPDYGLLALLIQLRYCPAGLFKIPATCFYPEPEVDSACVILVRRTQPLLPPQQHGLFDQIIARSFSQRRKMMLKLLKQDWPLEALSHAFAQLNLSPQIRAEAVSLEQFVQLAKHLGSVQWAQNQLGGE